MLPGGAELGANALIIGNAEVSCAKRSSTSRHWQGIAGQGRLDRFAAIRRALGRLQGRNAAELDGKAKPGVIGSALPETNPLLLGPCRA